MQPWRVDMHFCTVGLADRAAPCKSAAAYFVQPRPPRGREKEQEDLRPMARSHPVDVHVGARMRQRRTLLGMSQEKLGTAVGLTFQQIQKYERGSNRIGSSRLYEFAKVLDVPVSYFFDEMPSNALSGRPMSGRGRKGVRRGRHAVRAGKGSADQARDAGAGARLLQDPRKPRAQAYFRDGQGGRCRQPCRGTGRPQGSLGSPATGGLSGSSTQPLDFRRHLEFLAARHRWSMPPRTDLDDLPPRQ